MDRLVSVVGPAPSELSFDALKVRLTKERNRMRDIFDTWNNSIGHKTKESGISLKDIKALAQKMNMSVEELNLLLIENTDALIKKGD